MASTSRERARERERVDLWISVSFSAKWHLKAWRCEWLEAPAWHETAPSVAGPRLGFAWAICVQDVLKSCHGQHNS